MFVNCQTTHFRYSLYPQSKYCDILMQTHPNFKSTSACPDLLSRLRKELGTILFNECFNPEGLSFEQEVINTETGHLFEHLVLEYLCQLKAAAGDHTACFDGRTYWSKEMRSRGVYLIRIQIPESETEFLNNALHMAYNFMERLIIPTNPKADSPTLSAWCPTDTEDYMSSVSVLSTWGPVG